MPRKIIIDTDPGGMPGGCWRGTEPPHLIW
jgi:hypothetical protein